MDCLQHFYLGPFPKRLWARWSEIKSFAPLAKESALVFIACGRKILGRYRRLVPMTPEAFSMMEYSVLFEALPIGSAARRYVVTNLQDHSPSGFRDCLRQYKETAMSQSPGASIWLATIPGDLPLRVVDLKSPVPLKAIVIRVPLELKKKVDVKLATVSFTAAVAETTEDSLEDPHFGKDDGATVDAVGENYLKRLPSSVQYTVFPFPAPVLVQTAGEDGAVVQATHSADVPDVMCGEKRADLSFLILLDSPVPFLFFKALAQRLGAVMDYRSDLMTIPSASGDPAELLWIDLGRYYAMTLQQAPVFEASPAISVTLSPAGPPAAFMATVSAPAEAPFQEISVSNNDDDDCPSLCGSSDTASDCTDGESACPNQGERDTVSLQPSFFPATFLERGERFVFLLSNLQSLVMEVHYDCAYIGVEDVLSLLRRVFSFEVSIRSLRKVIWKVLTSCVPCSCVKGPVGFSIPRSSFNRGAYPSARLHMDSQYLGPSESRHTHQLSIFEDYYDFGLRLRYNGPPTSAKAATFLRNVWIPYFGVPLEIRCDAGSEFIKEPFTSLCTKLNIIPSFSPSGYKDGNSLAERWQREVLVSVRTILLERGLPPTMWPTVHDETIRRLNNRLSRQDPSKPRQTAVFGAAPLLCFHQFLFSQRCPSPATLCKYAVGDEVMYNTGASLGGGCSGPKHKCGPVWYPYRVEAKENDHYYKIVATEDDTRPQKTSASPHQLRPSAVPFSPESPVVSSSADPSSSASEPPLPSVPSGPLTPGTMLVASSPEHSLLWVGEVHRAVPSGDDSRDFLYKVHVWGTHQKCTLEKRAWYPGHYMAGGSYVTYDSRGRRTDPKIVELHHSNVVASGFEMVKNRGALQFNVTADGILIHQHDYISSLSLPPEFSSSESRPADKPLPVGTTHEEDISPPLDAAGTRVYRELLGQVGYVTYCTRPDVSFAYSYLSCFIAAPTERAFRLLLQTIRYLRSTPFLGIPIRPSLNPDELIAVIHADASFGTPDSPHPQTGSLLFLEGSPFLYKSRRQSRVARSMTRAEVLTLENAVDASLHFAAYLIPFYKSVKIGIGCDAANVLHLLQSGGASSAERALLPLIRRLGDHACVVPLLVVTDLTE
uniref:Integrase catalytic domain-containing protein n=1 Tax=Chromera velia CCMP2878 TaxID=1169474 RepID=A0A0G4IA92_9ALVE|eukprot:Cvel_2081.t1-p1 / transcript=Cvel_2081.t1 / gene=Cvel_2081 / organism=Chromera_velia_CCMP2878 / gene_product=hypothetical protein / transcript_product=hypothetical protein / location=Cvel_scaffold80:90916-95336(+) / protein_length=1111 / sequence_SO=supercontig / SO=protein_coding / is_pseudo=false